MEKGINTGSTEELIEALKIGFEGEFGSKKVNCELRERPDGRQEYAIVEDKPEHPRPRLSIGSHVTYSPRQVVETISPSRGGFIYGDGNIATPGDLVESGNTVAEVKLVAGNGVVLNSQDKGNFVVSGSDLLKFRKL